MEYTEQEVIQELKSLYGGPKTRVRHLTDKRYYLIALLHYKFKIKEETIFKLTDLSSPSTINHAKRLGAELYRAEDPVFMRNSKDFIEKFPYDFPDGDIRVNLKQGTKTIKFRITPLTMERLTRYAKRKGFDSPNTGAKHILTNLLRLWEE
jgi:hypothetical protein